MTDQMRRRRDRTQRRTAGPPRRPGFSLISSSFWLLVLPRTTSLVMKYTQRQRYFRHTRHAHKTYKYALHYATTVCATRCHIWQPTLGETSVPLYLRASSARTCMRPCFSRTCHWHSANAPFHKGRHSQTHRARLRESAAPRRASALHASTVNGES